MTDDLLTDDERETIERLKAPLFHDVRLMAMVDVLVERLSAARVQRDEARLALSVDLSRANRDAMYRHDLAALVADGAADGCHTDVGTAVRERLATLATERDAAKGALFEITKVLWPEHPGLTPEVIQALPEAVRARMEELEAEKEKP